MSGAGPRSPARGRRGVMGIILLLAACADSGPVQEAPAKTSPGGRAPEGTVEMRAIEVATPGKAAGGSGTLAYRGETHPFAIAGLGVDGSGVTAVDAAGAIYNLHDLADFPGAYVAGQYGSVIGDAGAGAIWLENENKVILHLKSRHEGVRLAVDGDAVIIVIRLQS